MTELIEAALFQTAQSSVATEQYKMPELFEMPEESTWELPVEDLKKKCTTDEDGNEVCETKKERREREKAEQERRENLPVDDPWYCEPGLDVPSNFNSCPEICDPEVDEECVVPCACPPDEDGKYQKYCDRCPNPDRENDTLPRWLRIVAQFIGMWMEFHIVFLAVMPWWVLGIIIILADLIWDWLWYGIFFAFCKPCAYIFIWLLNIPMMFLHFPWYYLRLQLELVGFIFDGWTLFIGGDGCFLRWGQDCWFAKKVKERNHITWTDLVWLTMTPAVPQNTLRVTPWKEDDLSYAEMFNFPGSRATFEKRMYARREEVHQMMRVGNPATNIFMEFWGKVKALTFQSRDIL